MMIDNEGIASTAAPSCVGCGQDGRVVHADLRDRLFGAPGTWSIRRCDTRDCGLGWLDPLPAPADIGKLYATYYTHDVTDGEAADDVSDKPNLLLNLLARLMPWRSSQMRSGLCHLEDRSPGDLLEVGCGNGSFLQAATRAGWRVRGLDFDERAVARAKERTGMDIVAGDLLAMRYPDESFDAIVMINVIEHLPDTADIMTECRRILRPGGRVVMVTPNIDSLGYRLFGEDWRGLEIPRHLYLFSAASLTRFAKAGGFNRVSAFSPIGNGGTEFMVESSRTIALTAGRVPPSADARRMRWYGRIAALFGISRGEWVVLVADR